MRGAEPFWFEADSKIACVLVHGFTGTTHELRPLGKYLVAHGIAARGVLLSGHGTRPQEMARYSYRDWICDVDSAIDELLLDGKRVFLCGLSMGGTLALNVAARRRNPADIAGIISLSAPLRLVEWRLSFLPMASLLTRWRSWGNPDIKDQLQWERHVAYRRFSVMALVQLLRLLKETRGLARRVSQPLLVIQSRQDNTVPPFNAQLIFTAVSSQDTRLVWLENCYHVITLDYDSEQVHKEAADFIRERSS